MNTEDKNISVEQESEKILSKIELIEIVIMLTALSILIYNISDVQS